MSYFPIQDLNFRRHAQTEKPRVTWNSERRCFLPSEAALRYRYWPCTFLSSQVHNPEMLIDSEFVSHRGQAEISACPVWIYTQSNIVTQSSFSLQEKIARNRIWPVEIIRLPMLSVAKGRGKQQSSDEEQNVTFHGVAYVNMAPLLYPGIKKIQGAYLVKPFIDSEVFDKTKRKGNLLEEAAQISSGINRMVTPTVPAKLAASKTGAKDTKAKVSCIVGIIWHGTGVGCS